MFFLRKQEMNEIRRHAHIDHFS